MASPPQKARVTWDRLPERIRAAIERELGSPVISAISQPGGFSPGMASRLRSADGRRVFAKAVGPELNPDSPDIYREEARVAAALPPRAPAPQLLWTYDEGHGGWVVLGFEDVDGHPPVEPWREDELARVMEALIELSDMLTPCPIPLPSAGGFFADRINGWQLLQRDPQPLLDDWSRRHLDALAALEARAPELASGDTLIHCDIRSDNLLLTADRVVVVDWPYACVGASWIDLLAMAPSVTMQGGPEPQELFVRHPAARIARPDAVNAVLASIAGYFTQRSLQPPPPGIPTVRAFQAAQGEVARRWLAQRTGWR